jgi:hypothetical protein
MKRAGKRYPLLIYTRMLDLWWPPLLLIGLGLIVLAWPFYLDLYDRLTAAWHWMTFAALGVVVILASLLMLALRKFAHVRPYSDHLLLVTPFLRLNISNRRILRTSTAAMASLFPPRKLSSLRRDVIWPLLNRTAIVIEYTALPLSIPVLRLFLSPFFFKDKTPHLVILVENWMGFSTELESLQVGTSAPEPVTQRPSSILTQLPRK